MSMTPQPGFDNGQAETSSFFKMPQNLPSMKPVGALKASDFAVRLKTMAFKN